MLASTLLMIVTQAFPGPRGARTPGTLAITHVNLIPMSRDTVLRGSTVIVKDGRIVAMGADGMVRPPAGARVIDGSGKYLIPGLADLHTHLFADAEAEPDSLAPYELGVMLAQGLTAVRLMIGTPQHLTLRAALARGALLGPQLWVASPHLTGRADENARVVTTPEEARRAVREVADAGYDFVKLTNFVTARPVYDAIMAEARARRIRVDGHIDPQIGVPHALESGEHLQHLDGYLEAVLADSAPSRLPLTQYGVFRLRNWETIDYVDDAKIAWIAGRTARAGVYVTPTLAVFNTAFAKGQDSAEARARPDWAVLRPAHRTGYLRALGQYWNPANAAQRTPARRARYIAVRNAITKAISDSGGRILAGSDSPEWLMAYGYTLHRELEHLVEAGLTPYQALSAATRTPAEFLGAAGEWGTLELGKRADFVLLDANPLEDIRNTSRISAVAIGGRWLDQQARRRLLAQAAARIGGAP